MEETGTCPVCKRNGLRLRNGAIPGHHDTRPQRALLDSIPERCSGSGTRPNEANHGGKQ